MVFGQRLLLLLTVLEVSFVSDIVGSRSVGDQIMRNTCVDALFLGERLDSFKVFVFGLSLGCSDSGINRSEQCSFIIRS